MLGQKSRERGIVGRIGWSSSSFELSVVSFMQEDVYIRHTALALTLSLQVFS